MELLSGFIQYRKRPSTISKRLSDRYQTGLTQTRILFFFLVIRTVSSPRVIATNRTTATSVHNPAAVDAHKARNPDAPNLRQVHLIHAEFHDELNAAGFNVSPGQMGENITTRGVDLLNLPAGTRLHLGDGAVVELTGLRNPCKQLNGIQDGLMNATLEKREDGTLVRKAGVMSVVIAGGKVKTGDAIRVELPDEPHRPMEPV